MLRGQTLRLLGPLAALLLLSATLALPGVSHGSVVDQYTEERPTPDGNVPTKPSREVVQAEDDSGSNGDVGAILGEEVPGSGEGFEERSTSGKAGESGVSGKGFTSGSLTGEIESSGASGDMGPLFPAALLFALAMSVGFALRRRLGVADTENSR